VFWINQVKPALWKAVIGPRIATSQWCVGRPQSIHVLRDARILENRDSNLPVRKGEPDIGNPI
jgi:hypothetical protein